MIHCQSLYFLSTIACQLEKCLSAEELSILSADLSTLGDMLASILARQDQTTDSTEKSDTSCLCGSTTDRE